MYIPTEILQAITREAIAVPEAFNSSLDSILHDNRSSVSAAIRKSLLTKTALSLVSILFHQIVEEFLYEIIVIERFHVIPYLVKLLQSRASRLGRNKPRGFHCRRLEIHLGTRAVDYNDEAWYEGGHVLWGLIPACPVVFGGGREPLLWGLTYLILLILPFGRISLPPMGHNLRDWRFTGSAYAWTVLR
jgi:hypothetical protein